MNSEVKKAVDTAFRYLQADNKSISEKISTTTKDYLVNTQDLNGVDMTTGLILSTIIAISSVALGKPVISSVAVLGDISIGGTIINVEGLTNTLQVCLGRGAKKILLPLSSAADLGVIPPELMG